LKERHAAKRKTWKGESIQEPGAPAASQANEKGGEGARAFAEIADGKEGRGRKSIIRGKLIVDNNGLLLPWNRN